MVKALDTKSHQSILDALNRYNTALKNKETAYMEQVRQAELRSEAQAKAWDSVFVLNCMIASNQRVINFLEFLQKANNTRANTALDDLIKLIDINPDDNSGGFVNALSEQLAQDGKLAKPLENYYFTLGVLSVLGSMALFVTAVLLGVFLSASLGPIVFLPVVVLALCSAFLYATGGEFITNSRRPSEYVNSIQEFQEGTHEKTLSYSFHTQNQHGQIEEITQVNKSMAKPVTQLRDTFFSSRETPESATLSEEVHAEFNNLKPK